MRESCRKSKCHVHSRSHLQNDCTRKRRGIQDVQLGPVRLPVTIYEASPLSVTKRDIHSGHNVTDAMESPQLEHKVVAFRVANPDRVAGVRPMVDPMAIPTYDTSRYSEERRHLEDMVRRIEKTMDQEKSMTSKTFHTIVFPYTARVVCITPRILIP